MAKHNRHSDGYSVEPNLTSIHAFLEQKKTTVFTVKKKHLTQDFHHTFKELKNGGTTIIKPYLT